MSSEMIPMMIEQGYRAIAVTFDVWGFANMVNDGVKNAKAVAQGMFKGKAATNGTKTDAADAKATS